MSLSEYHKAVVHEFGGAWLRLDPPRVPPSQALIALNCEFSSGQVATRKGFGPVAVAYNIRSLYDWISSLGNYLFFFGGVHSLSTLGLYQTPLVIGTAPSVVSLGAVTGIGGVFAPGGAHLLFAPFTSLMVGADHGRVITPTYADNAFAGPQTIAQVVEVLTVSGTTASVTPGLHRVGWLIQTRTGFTGRISPVVAATQAFDTVSAITSAATQQINLSIQDTWPADAVLVYAVMTTVDNLDRFFIVPGLAPVAVVGGVSSTASFVITVSDSDLASVGTNVTDNQFLLTQTSAGVAPFLPFSVGSYGSRTVWLTEIANISQAYVSEPNSAQAITADQHVLQLPGNRQMRAQGAAGRTLYILGPHWTHAFEDTGDVPVLWPPPRLVDGSIGTLSPHGFTIDASTGIGWCADVNGLYFFSGGFFAPLPVSYYSHPDWRRINWSTGTIPSTSLPRSAPVVVVDDKARLRVIVMAGLDMQSTVNTAGTAVTITGGHEFPASGMLSSGALVQQVLINGTLYTLNSITDATHGVLSASAGTQTGVAFLSSFAYPTHLLVYDYSGGVTPEKIKYSLWEIKSFVPGGICIVQSPSADDHSEVWLGEWLASDSTYQVLRQMGSSIYDASPYSDNSLAINWQWEHAPLPGMELDLGAVYYHYAQQVRVTGSGSLARTLYGLDRTKSVPLTAITLATAPGQAYTNRFERMRSEGASVRFSLNAANSYAIISGIEHFYGLGPRRR